jgi:hypothetical protein
MPASKQLATRQCARRTRLVHAAGDEVQRDVQRKDGVNHVVQLGALRRGLRGKRGVVRHGDSGEEHEEQQRDVPRPPEGLARVQDEAAGEQDTREHSACCAKGWCKRARVRACAASAPGRT